MKNQQLGISFIGILFVGGVLAFTGVIAAQVFPTLVEFVLLLGGLQLMTIGIMGEYVGRLYLESKRRPIYLLDSFMPATLSTTEET